MAVIASTNLSGPGDRELNVTTLGESDTLTYTDGAVLIINNVTVGTITPVITGADASTVPVPGVGEVDVSGGFTLSAILAGEQAVIPLNAIRNYLVGVTTVTAADGAEAALLVP